MNLQCTINIPASYRYREILAFHARDRSSLAEQVGDNSLRKAIMLNGIACEITLHFADAQARFGLVADGVVNIAEDGLSGLGERILGLPFDAPQFETAIQHDPHLGVLVQRQSGLNIPMVPTPFEALIWAITGQQLTVSFAVQCRHSMIALAGVRHSNGLYCHPDAPTVARFTLEQLTRLKFSGAKAATIIHVAELIADGRLDLDAWLGQLHEPDVAVNAYAQLLAIKGIGPWTANYTLMRGLGHRDCSLHGDVAVRNALQVLLGNEGKISIPEAQQWLARYAPWRSLVAAHLWASKQVLA